MTDKEVAEVTALGDNNQRRFNYMYPFVDLDIFNGIDKASPNKIKIGA